MTVTKVTDLTIAPAEELSSSFGDGIHELVSTEGNQIRAINWRDLEADKPLTNRFFRQLLLCNFHRFQRLGRSVRGIVEHGQEGITAELQLSSLNSDPIYQEVSPPVKFDSIASAKKWCELAALEVLEIMGVPYPAINSEVIAFVGEDMPYPGVMEIEGEKFWVTGFGLATVEDVECRQIWGIRNRIPCMLGMEVDSQFLDAKVPLPEVRLGSISETAWRMLFKQARKLQNERAVK